MHIRHAFPLVAAMMAAAILLPACSAPQIPPSAFNPTDAFVSTLKANAASLAQRELEKFNAAEAQYKSAVSLEVNPFEPNPFRQDIGAYMKWYRHFPGYRIEDIRRSESLLNPIEVIIAFDCEMWSTVPREEDTKDTFLGVDPEKNAANDTEFSLHRKVVLKRSYACDSQGNYIGGLPDVPERGMFYVQGDEFEKMRLMALTAGG